MGNPAVLMPVGPNHRLSSRLRGAVCQRLDRQVKLVAAELCTLQIHERRQVREAMAVQLQRAVVDDLPQRWHQRPDAIDGEESTCVLDHDAADVGAVDERLGYFHVVVVGMQRTFAE